MVVVVALAYKMLMPCRLICKYCAGPSWIRGCMAAGRRIARAPNLTTSGAEGVSSWTSSGQHLAGIPSGRDSFRHSGAQFGFGFVWSRL